MKKFGYRPLGHECDYDDSRLNERVRKYGGGADQIITWARGEANRIVNEHWASIEYLVGVLQVFGDEMDEGSLQTILKHIPRGNNRGQLMRRKDGFVSAELWTRKGLAAPRGLDPVTREIDCVISTGAAVRRRDWDGEFLETLDMSPKAVRLARLNQGGAVLDAHNWQAGVGAMLGGIVPGSAQITNGELTARIKFSRGSELAQRVTKDLEDGI
jgi:hypothetical protein